MSRTAWKKREREAARLISGRRHPANSGGRIDCESATCVAQVKERRTLSLRALETLALELERIGAQQNKPGSSW